jgi:hypothetical protein
LFGLVDCLNLRKRIASDLPAKLEKFLFLVLCQIHKQQLHNKSDLVACTVQKLMFLEDDKEFNFFLTILLFQKIDFIDLIVYKASNQTLIEQIQIKKLNSIYS